MVMTESKATNAGPHSLTFEEICSRIESGTPQNLYSDKRVLVLTPDTTRTAPLPMMVRAVRDVIGGRAKKLDFMVALGTHPILDDRAILKLYGIEPADQYREFASIRFLNHRWDLPNTLEKIGQFSKNEIGEITDGRFSEAIEVTINRIVFEYDLLLILGPVFPHEIVGFSGGNKYLFPGISGGEFLDFFHWLSAVITCMKTIGHKSTPARTIVDRAAMMVPVRRHCIAMVVRPGAVLDGLYVGNPEDAWSQAADHSARVHIVYQPRRYDTVLGKAPEMYDEMWVGGKIMYKLESIVADGGTLIIYGPHIMKLSSTWGQYLREVGYHVAPFLLANMDRYRDIPRGVLAHSALVSGNGSYVNDQEHRRINVVLATGIPENVWCPSPQV